MSDLVQIERWTLAIHELAVLLVDDPTKVSVRAHQSEDVLKGPIEVRVSCAAPDVGRLVGRSNQTVHALRVLTRAFAGKIGQSVMLRIEGHNEPLPLPSRGPRRGYDSYSR